MEMTILNSDFEAIYILDTYESFIWVDKMYEPGTFELYTPITEEIVKYAKPDNYIQMRDSEKLMIIEDISIESDIESGDHIKIVGRSLESILDRRIVWTQTNFKNTNLQTAVNTLLTNAIINPSIADRKIENFIFETSTDPRITKLKLTKEFTGDSLLDIIQDICEENKFGFKIILNDNKQFVMSFFFGLNRSYSQSSLPYVVFSPSFDNIISSNYTDVNSQMKNVTLVAGEGEGKSRKTKVVGVKKGLARRELYTDARDLQKGSLSNANYLANLEKRGLEKLTEANKKRSFDGKCVTTEPFSYGNDFFLGDIVEIANEYGIESPATVTEFTWSYSSNGSETYPTFVAVEDSIITGKNKLVTSLEEMQADTTYSDGEWAANIWERSDFEYTVNQDTFERVVGITINGKNSSGSEINVVIGTIDAERTDLVLNGCSGGSSTTYGLAVRDDTAGRVLFYSYDGDTVLTGLDLTHTITVRFFIKNGKTVDNLTLYPMVRYSDETSTFEPYDLTQEET